MTNSVLLGRGQVWYVNFPFEEDPTKSKERPCVVVGWSNLEPNNDHMLWLMPIYTFDNNSSRAKRNDILLDDFGADFLRKGSYLRVSRIFSIGMWNFNSKDNYVGTLPSAVINIAMEEMIKVFERKGPFLGS